MKTSSGHSIRAILFGLALSVPCATAATVTIDASTTPGNDYDSMNYRGGGERGTIYTLKNGEACNNHFILDNGGTDSFKAQLATAARDGGSSLLLSGNVIDIMAGSAFNAESKNKHVLVGAYMQNGSGTVQDNTINVYGGTKATQVIAGQIHDPLGSADENLLTGNRIYINLGDSGSAHQIFEAVMLTGTGNGHTNGNSIDIENSTLTRTNNSILAADNQATGSGDACNNRVTIKNSEVHSTVHAAARYYGTGHVDNNEIVIRNCEMSENGGTRVAYHGGTGGTLKNNRLEVTDSNIEWASTAYVAGNIDEASGNVLILDNAAVRNEICVVQLKNSGSPSVGKAHDNTLILKGTSNGKYRDDVAGVIGVYSTPAGTVSEAWNNVIILDKTWTGAATCSYYDKDNIPTTYCTPYTLSKVANFDEMRIEWEEGHTLTINNLSANATEKGGDLTFVLNDIDTKVQVGSFTNVQDKAVAVKATGRVRDQMGEGQQLEQNLQKLASAVSVGEENGVAAPHVTESVTAEEGVIHGAVSATLDAEGNIVRKSIVQKENSVNTSLSSIAGVQYLAYRSQLNDLQNRLSALRAMPASKNNAFWARAFGGKDKYTALGSDYHYSGAQVGADRRFGRYIAGLAFGYTDARTSRINGRADDTQYSLGAYGSWQGRKGQFVDVVAKHTRMSSDHELYATNGERSTGEQDNWGCSISAEYGWHITLPGNGFYLEPRAGLMYAYLDDVGFTTSRGVRVDQSDAEAIIGRLGITAGYVFANNKASVYARADVLHDWGGDTNLTMSHDTASRRISHNLSETFGEFALGGTVGVTDNSYIFSEVQMRTGEHIDQPWHVNIGISVGF